MSSKSIFDKINECIWYTVWKEAESQIGINVRVNSIRTKEYGIVCNCVDNGIRIHIRDEMYEKLK